MVYKWLKIYYHELKHILQRGRFAASLSAGKYKFSTCGLDIQQSGTAVATEN
jgi:hypothetical protein